MCEHLCDPDIFLDIGSEKFNKVNNFHLFSEISHLFESTEEIEAGIVRSNKCYQGQYRNHDTVIHCPYSFFPTGTENNSKKIMFLETKCDYKI